MIRIYHNPRCSKSRIALETLIKTNNKLEVIEYLNDLFTEDSLQKVIQQLGISPIELVRKNESIFIEQFKGKILSDEQWIKIMVENPKLIQRPIVVTDSRACIARDEQNLKNLLK